MTLAKVCSIPDCGKITFGRGWCNAHYMRWCRHGDPLGGGTTKGNPLRYFRETVLAFDGNECLIWPYGHTSTGYGRIQKNGRSCLAHRLICEEVNGPSPTSKHVAAHRCGNRNCVNPKHLRWATPQENEADKLLHGTSNRGQRNSRAKLTESEVRQIRDHQGAVTPTEIAERFGVSRRQVSRIHRREEWGWL